MILNFKGLLINRMEESIDIAILAQAFEKWRLYIVKVYIVWRFVTCALQSKPKGIHGDVSYLI